MPKKKKKKLKFKFKIKWKNWLKFFLVIVAIILLIKIIMFFANSVSDQNEIEKINKKINQTKMTNVVDDKKTIISPPSDDTSKFDDYYEFIKLGLMNVDLSIAKEINNNTVGWIEIEGTNISYPIVMKDNNFYKNHNLKNEPNKYGWIYFDNKTNLDTNDNIVIYGNKNSDDLLLGELNYLFDKKYTSDSGNFIIRLYTEKSTSLWQIVSAYHSKKIYTNNYISHSEFNYTDSSLNENDKIMTIIASGNKNIVVHAKALKIKYFK